jgi:drug/metabolite transporter (DMT)-like permease
VKTKLALALGTTWIVWGSTYLAIAVTNRTLPPLLMLSARFLLAGGLLLAWSWRRGDLRRARPGRRELAAAAVVGIVLLCVDTGGVAWAEQRVPSGLTALLIATVPVFTALLDRTVLGIRLTRRTGSGIAVGLFGVALLVGPSTTIDPLGAAVILVAAFAWASGSVYARVAPLPRAPYLSAALQMLCAGAVLALVGTAAGEAGRVHLGAVSPVSLAAFAYLVVAGSIVAFTAYAWLLRSGAPSALVGTYAYVNPAVAVLLGWALAGEHVGGRELAAGAVILGSVGMLMLADHVRPAVEPVAESLAPYIRRQQARVAAFPSAPPLADLRRLSA